MGGNPRREGAQGHLVHAAEAIPSGPAAMYDYLKNTKSFADRAGTEKGNAAGAMAQAAKKFDNTYLWPFQMHAMIGPSCAVADVRGDKATIWSGSQAPFITRNGVARLLGLPEQNVHFIYTEGSGCYGRLEPDDAPEDAALMSRATGRPVRVQWMREDEHGWEPKGPPQLISIRSGLDAQGKVVAWDYSERTLPWTDARLSPMLASRQTGIKPDENGVFLGGNDGAAYNFENRKAVVSGIPWIMSANPLRTCNLRAPYSQARCFATESPDGRDGGCSRRRSSGISPAPPQRGREQAHRRRLARGRQQGAMAGPSVTSARWRQEPRHGTRPGVVGYVGYGCRPGGWKLKWTNPPAK